ncbi:glutaredoxin, partial [Protomyces lactucae-debilis]
VEKLISRHKVMVFSKSYCGHSRAAKTLLKQQGIQHTVVELDQHPNGAMMQKYLGAKTKQHTVPQTFKKGRFIGGNSDLQRHMEVGKLKKIL